MKSVAYKWRLSTTKYAYITSIDYNPQNPNYMLGIITTGISDNDELIIIEKVKNMNRNEYKLCFEYISEVISNDVDGKYLNLHNWEYYYNLTIEDSNNYNDLFIGATASAENATDNNASVDLTVENGFFDFKFKIPSGMNGKDGKDGEQGLPGTPGKNGISAEYIYLLTNTNTYGNNYNPQTWVNDFNYQKDNFIPNGWTKDPIGISAFNRYEFVSVRKRGDDEKWGLFSEPALMSRWGEDGKDGDKIEYVYTTTLEKNAPTIQTPDDWNNINSVYQTTDEYFIYLDGWTDSPSGVGKNGNKFEWVSIRKQKDGIWQPFSSPSLWANWGEDGNGIEYVYFLTSENVIPVLDNYDIESDEYQKENFLPSTNSEKWDDEYVKPTFLKKYCWVSIRKYNEGTWDKFTSPKLWNTYKANGKTFVDMYARSNIKLTDNDLPFYNGNIYYSYKTNKFYNDKNISNNEITTLTSINSIVWYNEIPDDASLKMLYKITAQVELFEDIDELVEIPKELWHGPYLMASNGENAVNIAPYIILDDDSLSVPIKQDTKEPHEEYNYLFNASLYYNSDVVTIQDANYSLSNENNITILNSEIIDGNKFNVNFKINNNVPFNEIGIIYVTLKGVYEGNEIESTSNFKIIPFITEDPVLYKILLTNNNIFVPNNPCEGENIDDIWKVNINASIINNKGDILDLKNTNNLLGYENNEGEFKIFPDSGITLTACEYLKEENNDYILIQELPNPLKIVLKNNDNVLEIEYVNFTNLPLNGKDGKNGTSSRILFAYCSTKEGIIPQTPFGGSIDFSNNQIIEYPQSEDGLIWGSSDIINNEVIYLSQCEFFSDGTQDLTWTKPIRLSGVKGESPYHIEQTNDVEQFYTTDENVLFEQSGTTILSLFKGNEKLILDKKSIIVNGNNMFNIVIENENDDVKLTIIAPKGVKLNEKEYLFDVIINGDNYNINAIDFLKTFKIKILNGTKDYDLNLNHTFIKKDKNNIFSETALTLNVTERDIMVDSKKINILENLPENIVVKYYYNDDANENIINFINFKSNFKIPINNTAYGSDLNKISFYLFKDNVVIDSVFIECISDGKDGSNGESTYQLLLTNSNASINCDNNGNILPNAIRPSCKFYLYYGNTLIEDVEFSIETDAIGIDICGNTLTYDETFTFSGVSTEILVKAYVNNVLLGENTMNLNKTIAGKNGANGNDAVTYWMEFNTNAIIVTNNKPNISAITIVAKEQIGQKAPTNVSKEFAIGYAFDSTIPDKKYDKQITIDINKNYITIHLTVDGYVVDVQTIPIIKNGVQGKQGKLIYPAGEWNSETTYYGTDEEKTPYVLYKQNNKYYVLTINQNVSGLTYEPNNSSAWTEMKDYEAIYTKLLVAENGVIGGSVYNGDYVFSKNGIDDKGNSTSIYSGFSSNIVDEVFSSNTVNSEFTPNYLVDFNKGRAWFGSGKTIINENGGIISNEITEIINDKCLRFPGTTQPSGMTMDDTVEWDYTYEITYKDYNDSTGTTSGYTVIINTLNNFVYDHHSIDVCSNNGVVVLKLLITDENITRTDVFYKGSLFHPKHCQCYLNLSHYYNEKYLYTEEYKNKLYSLTTRPSLEFLFKWDGNYKEYVMLENGSFRLINLKTGYLVIINDTDDARLDLQLISKPSIPTPVE